MVRSEWVKKKKKEVGNKVKVQIVKGLVCCVMDWMCVSPQNLYVQVLTPNEMILEGEAFGR